MVKMKRKWTQQGIENEVSREQTERQSGKAWEECSAGWAFTLLVSFFFKLCPSLFNFSQVFASPGLSPLSPDHAYSKAWERTLLFSIFTWVFLRLIYWFSPAFYNFTLPLNWICLTLSSETINNESFHPLRSHWQS